MYPAAQAQAVSSEQRQVLEGWVRASTTPQRVVAHARIVLLAAQGVANATIARRLGTRRTTVILWRRRFAEGGPEALTKVAPGRGRKPTISQAKVREIVDATRLTTPPAATHWSCRSMAKAQGVSRSTVHRSWQAYGLKPHLVETFKLSTDPQFADKLVDIVGLYLDPPDKALVLCVDEKSQIQALDRTQPGLPMKKGRCGTLTHDYKRHGTTSLFAALNLLDGTVIAQCYPQHRHQEFLRFLRRLDRQCPGLELHLILDNYGTHKHPQVKAWLENHARFTLHFTPTSSSWLNLIERWFGELTQKRLRRGVFRSVPDLVRAIEEFVTIYNQDPIAFKWTRSAETILAKVRKCSAISESLH